MRCKACDDELSDFESTRKSATTGDFLDMCGRCLGYIVEFLDTVEDWELYDARVDDLSSISGEANGVSNSSVGTTDDDGE